MARVETIPCRPVPAGKGEYGYLPTRPIQLRPGDRAIWKARGANRFIEVHRASWLKRTFLTIVRGS